MNAAQSLAGAQPYATGSVAIPGYAAYGIGSLAVHPYDLPAVIDDKHNHGQLVQEPRARQAEQFLPLRRYFFRPVTRRRQKVAFLGIVI
jgi:hypothetical protein